MTPVVVKLDMIPRDACATHHLESFIVEAREMGTPLEGSCYRTNSDEESIAKVRLQSVNEPDDADQRHFFFDIKIESIQVECPDHFQQWLVIDFEICIALVQSAESPLRSSADHAQNLDAHILKDLHLFPQLCVFGRVGGVVVQSDVSRSFVEMNGSDDEVTDADTVCRFRQEWENRDVLAISVIVGLVIADYTGLEEGQACRRHEGIYMSC